MFPSRGKPPLALSSLAKFTNRSWWSRVWVLQEYALSKKAYFCCGKARVDAYRALLALESLSMCLWPALLLGGLHREELRLAERPAGVLDIWTDLIDDLRESKLPRLATLVSTLSGSGMQSTDPRDRIYAVLGIVEDTLGLEPNYEVSYEDLYIRMSRKLLENGDMFILLYNKADRSDELIPSWVADWTQKLCSGLVEARKTRFSAAADTLPVVQFEATEAAIPTTLLISGKSFHFITHIGDSLDECGGDKFGLYNNFSLWFQRFVSLKLDLIPQNEKSAGPVGTVDFLLKMVWELMGDGRSHKFLKEQYGEDLITFLELVVAVLGNMKSGKFPEVEYGKAVMTFLEGEVGEVDTSQTTRLKFPTALAFGLSLRLLSQRSFVTEQRHLCVGPEHTRVGDLTVILRGVDTPVVLREVGDGYYSLIGPAYVPGIMSGEFMRNKRMNQRFSRSGDVSAGF